MGWCNSCVFCHLQKIIPITSVTYGPAENWTSNLPCPSDPRIYVLTPRICTSNFVSQSFSIVSQYMVAMDHTMPLSVIPWVYHIIHTSAEFLQPSYLPHIKLGKGWNSSSNNASSFNNQGHVLLFLTHNLFYKISS